MYPGTISDMHMMTLRSTEIARMRCAPIAHVGPMSMHPCRHVGPCFMFMFMFMCSCKHVHGSMFIFMQHDRARVECIDPDSFRCSAYA